MAAKAKQLYIAGTEPKIPQRLIDAASIYQGFKMDRMELTKQEVKHKNELKSVITQLVKDEEILLPEDYVEGTKVVIARYESEHGPLEVLYGRKEVVQVRKEKPVKATGVELVDEPDEDDEDEA